MVLLDLLHVQRAGFFKLLKIGIDKELSQLNINVDNTRLQVIPFLDTLTNYSKSSTHDVMDLTESSQKDRKQRKIVKGERRIEMQFLTKKSHRSKMTYGRNQRVGYDTATSCKAPRLALFVGPQISNVETSSNLLFSPNKVMVPKDQKNFESSFESSIQSQSPKVLKYFPNILSYKHSFAISALSPRFNCGKFPALSLKHFSKKIHNTKTILGCANIPLLCQSQTPLRIPLVYPQEASQKISYPDQRLAKRLRRLASLLTISYHLKNCYNFRTNKLLNSSLARHFNAYTAKLCQSQSGIFKASAWNKEFYPSNQSSCFRLIASKYTPREAIIYQKSWSCKLVVKVLLTVHEKKVASRFIRIEDSLQMKRPYLHTDTAKLCEYPLASFAKKRYKQVLTNQRFVRIATDSTNSLRMERPSVSTEPLAKKQQENKQKNQKRDHELFLVLGELPLMTKRGHFIIHGSPRVILSQLIRTPGIYFTQKNNELQADCVPEQGPWLCIYKNLSDGTHSKITTVETKERPTNQKETLSDHVKTNGILNSNSKDLSFIDSLLYSNYRNESKFYQNIYAVKKKHNEATLPSEDRQASYFCYTKQFSSMPFSLVYSTFRVFELHSQFTDQTLLLTKLKTLEKIRKFKEVITTLLTFTWKKRVRRRLQKLYTKRCFTSTQQFEKTKLLFRLKKKLILGPLSRKSFNEKLGMSSCINTGVNHNAFNNDFFNTSFLSQQPYEYKGLPMDVNARMEVGSPGLTSTQSNKEILSNLFVDSRPYAIRTSPRLAKGTYHRRFVSTNITSFCNPVLQKMLPSVQKESSILKNCHNKQTNQTIRETDNFSSNGLLTDHTNKGNLSVPATCRFVSNEWILSPRTMLSKAASREIHDKQTKEHGFPLGLNISKKIIRPKIIFDDNLSGFARRDRVSKKDDLHTSLDQITPIRSEDVTPKGISRKVGNTDITSLCKYSPWLNSTTLLSRDLALIARFLDGYKILPLDDIDDLNNQRIRTSSDQIQQQVRIGFFRFKKMFIKLISSGGTSQTITDFLNGALREFFGSNPLSQFLDQTNPLAEITHKRRISKLGLNGIQRESATLKVRTIHSTYFGRICPIETPEGINAGLVNSLTCLSRVDQKGQLVTPLSILIEGQKQEQFFYYSNKEDLAISTTDTALLKFHRLPNQFIYTKNESQFQQLEPSKVKVRVKSDLQTISLATALIPFLAYDDANRALMGSNMQRQAVPLILPERPIIRTGMESLVINESGHSFQSPSGGFISYISAQYVIILCDALNKRLLV